MHAYEIQIPSEKLKTAQVIAFALPMGILFFLGALLMMNPILVPVDYSVGFLESLLLVMTATSLPLAFFISGKTFSSAAQKKFQGMNLQDEVRRESMEADSEKESINQFMEIFQLAMIIRCGMIEATGFFALMVYLVGGTIWGPIIAGLIILVLFSSFPTRGRMQSKLHRLMHDLDAMPGSREIQ